MFVLADDFPARIIVVANPGNLRIGAFSSIGNILDIDAIGRTIIAQTVPADKNGPATGRHFARHGLVDCFSHYLSLCGEGDERVEGALEEMMEKVAWL